MTTDEELNFGSMVTSPPPFNLDFEHDKELPPINCIDLFPNPPTHIDDEDEQRNSSDEVHNFNLEPNNRISRKENNKEKFFRGFNIENTNDIVDTFPKNGKVASELTKKDVKLMKHDNKARNKIKTNNINLMKVDRKTAEKLDFLPEEKHLKKISSALNITSPASSLSSCYSSAESVSSTTSTKKKRKKKYCQTCNLQFRRTHELLHHLRIHVSLPIVELKKLSENDVKFQEYLQRQRNNKDEKDSLYNENKECGSLKLKLRLSKSHNFQVVSPSKPTEKPKKNIRILTAQEIKYSPRSSPTVAPIDAMVALSEMHLKPKEQSSTENTKYFECPTLDGLDQFAEEVNNEAAEELLKKLLEGGQPVPQENDWVSNTNEFISIDRLAHICTVCHSNFADAIQLYEHKRITQHDFQHSMQPPPPPSHHMNILNNFNHRPRHNFQSPSLLHAYQQPNQQMNSINMRTSFPNFPQRYPVSGPGFIQPQNMARQPPPLYRVPNPHGAQPVNMAPFAEMNPEMYIPSTNGNIMMNGSKMQPFQHHSQNLTRQPIFLKARLPKSVLPRTPIQDQNSNRMASPPIIMSQPFTTGPRLHQPPYFGGVPPKKSKQEIRSDDCEVISTQPRLDGLPVIQSVQGGATSSSLRQNETERPKDPIQLSDQITLSVKSKEINKNPKEVANILAHRGITVTHKSKQPLRESSPKSSAQEAVQKLQLNNSVSIISKRKTPEREESPKHRTGDSAFIPCPVTDCDEKFLTQEGLNRHTQRGHKMGKISLKAFKCKICPALFSTQEGLVDHQRRSHRAIKTSADELGIPVIDLRNEETKQKLAALGIMNYIPLNAKTPNGCYGFPVVSVQGAVNPNICNVLGLGVNSLLSLGPVKQIPISRRNDS